MQRMPLRGQAQNQNVALQPGNATIFIITDAPKGPDNCLKIPREFPKLKA